MSASSPSTVAQCMPTGSATSCSSASVLVAWDTIADCPTRLCMVSPNFQVDVHFRSRRGDIHVAVAMLTIPAKRPAPPCHQRCVYGAFVNDPPTTSTAATGCCEGNEYTVPAFPTRFRVRERAAGVAGLVPQRTPLVLRPPPPPREFRGHHLGLSNPLVHGVPEFHCRGAM